MSKGLKPAEAFHPSDFIKEELEARGWTLDELAMRMGSEEFGIHRLSLDFYMELGATEPNLRIGEASAEALGRAFGVSPELFLNLERAWLEAHQVDPDSCATQFATTSTKEKQP